jgi:hypothetical protein
MFTISKTFTRPSVDIAWWQDTPEAQQFNSLYGNSTVEQSPNGLSFTLTITYDNEAQYLAMLANPTAKTSIDQRIIYNTTHGIIEGTVSARTI